jgi:diaminohydroxyphosphoribosylaminopyrimidine deaminase/5-amino-6-(5-phosphoribosylamino)uracil reductase
VASADIDEKFMRLAFREAKKGIGLTSPNPSVGAILVVNGKVISRAHHRGAGNAHAEIECLEGAGTIPRGATLYVTLEPCSTVGRTGRCTDAIVRAGVRKVVIGTLDVNPRHNGRGVAVLEKAGIAVRTGVLEGKCAALNEAFNKWIVTGRPFVIAKCGMSLDGRLTRPRGESRSITGAAARRDAHRLRAQVDAILIGAETARADDPRLTVRGVPRTTQPWRVILTRSGRLPKQLRLLRDSFKKKTLVYRKKPLAAVLRDLGKKNVTSVLIEGGGDVLGQALDAGLIDKVQIYVGAIFTGGPVLAFAGRGVSSTKAALQLRGVTYGTLGNDVRVVGYAREKTAGKGE